MFFEDLGEFITSYVKITEEEGMEKEKYAYETNQEMKIQWENL